MKGVSVSGLMRPTICCILLSWRSLSVSANFTTKLEEAPCKRMEKQKLLECWTDGWWIDGWMGGWVDVWMGGWMDWWVDVWMNEWVDESMDGWMSVWVNYYRSLVTHWHGLTAVQSVDDRLSLRMTREFNKSTTCTSQSTKCSLSLDVQDDELWEVSMIN